MALYTVKQGDTLFLISQKVLGDGNRYPEILNLNSQIEDPNLIHAGDLLQVPDTQAARAAQNEDHTVVTVDPNQPAMSTNAKVLLVSGLAAAAAAAWWWMGKNPMAKRNPENEEESEDDLDDEPNDDDTEEDEE